MSSIKAGTLHPTRRQILALGAAAPLAFNLAAVAAAAAQVATSSSDYRALVCVFLLGGNDSNNLLVATDKGSFDQYWAARTAGSSPIALMPAGTAPVALGQVSSLTKRTVNTTDMPEYWGGVLPITPKTAQPVPAANMVTSVDQARTFGLHPMLPAVQKLFGSGRAALVANVGTLLTPLTKAEYQKPSPATQIPSRLFSHADQQAAWQTGQVGGATQGWGGLMLDGLQAGQTASFAAVTTAGNTPFLSGVSTRSFRVAFANSKSTAQQINLIAATGVYNQSRIFLDEFRKNVRETALGGQAANSLVTDYAAAVGRSVDAAASYNSALSAANGPYAQVPAPATFTNPLTSRTAANPLADQLQAVAQTAAAHSALGVKRQVFFVTLGGFDTHDGENGRQSLLMAQIDHALSYFDTALGALGLADKVTTFTASDFNRTWVTNGDGTDHAWGGHHLVTGAAVQGGDIYGTFPTVGIDRAASGSTPAFKNPDAAGNVFIPTTSVETYLATLAAWLGLSPAQINTVFPRLVGFSVNNMGFMRA